MAWDSIKVSGEVISSADFNVRTIRIKQALGAADLVTFADGDATPSVANATLFNTNNTAPVTITDFVDATEKVISVMFDDAFTSVAENANIQLEGGFGPLGPLPRYSGLTFRYDTVGGFWVEISRSIYA